MSNSEPSWSEFLNSATLLNPLETVKFRFNLAQCAQFPRSATWNDWIEQQSSTALEGIEFRDQQYVDESLGYYEEIIYEHGFVPTREDSWHDLFNALIWLQFPKTKRYLNELHIRDIRVHGTHPRTRRRNHITHFDECGVVFAIPRKYLVAGNELLTHLADHRWIESLYNERHSWGKAVHAEVFGHANFEMMLNPYKGLTGKWLAVVVDDDFSSLTWQRQRELLDDAMLSRIRELADFTLDNILKPIPLMGIPNWAANQDSEFYCDESCFRPRRDWTKPTVQLPLQCLHH